DLGRREVERTQRGVVDHLELDDADPAAGGLTAELVRARERPLAGAVQAVAQRVAVVVAQRHLRSLTVVPAPTRESISSSSTSRRALDSPSPRLPDVVKPSDIARAGSAMPGP